jgi:hypothetical protein
LRLKNVRTHEVLMRAVLLSWVLILGSIATVSAQSTPASPTISVAPAVASPDAERDIHVANLAPGATALIVLFDPDGNQTVYRPQADSTGSVDLAIAPPSGAWTDGVYRAVLSLGGGGATSATFVASDGQPHLYAGPDSPSPTSALVFQGTGFPPNSAVTLHLWPTGGHIPDRDLQATTDANGTFVTYLWPDQLGVSFFPAGPYLVAVPSYGLQASFTVREHPNSALIALLGDQPAQPDQAERIQFQHYVQGRYLWGVVTGPDGIPASEFLLGPTDTQGEVIAALSLPDRGAGTYYLATPYDWGELSLDVVEPTATVTPTATSTPRPTPKPTSRPKPTSKPTATPVRKPVKKKCRVTHTKKGRKQTCRKRR